MTEVRIASYNVENLFARPRAFDPLDWSAGEGAVKAHAEFNALIANPVYSDANRRRMRDLLVILDIYTVNQHGAVRRKQTTSPRWAWLRKNRVLPAALDEDGGDRFGEHGIGARVIAGLS